MSEHDFTRQLPFDGAPPTRSISLLQAIHIDAPLLGLILTLCTLGLFVVYSASNENINLVYRQATYIGVGLAAMFIVAQVHPRNFYRWAPWLYTLGVGLLIAVLLVGTNAKGAQRWLDLPGLPRFQPSELLKLVVPMMVAWFLSSRILPPANRPVITAIFIIALPCFLIAKQPDLGTSLLIGSSGIFVVFLAGISFRLIATTMALGAAALPALWYVMHDYQKQRVLTFLSPERDPLGTGWNIIQSKVAIGSGGVYGKGWLDGTQSHLNFLPESSTDFIIAVFAEEFGLFGCIGLVAIYLLIVFRGLYISAQAQDTHSRLLSGSITLTFFVYVFVNIGMVSGLLPVVGVPLPLVSVGGTSIVTLMLGFGMLMSIETHKNWLSQ